MITFLSLLAAVVARAVQHPPTFNPPAPSNYYMQPGDDTYIAVFAGLHHPPSRQLGQVMHQNSTAESSINRSRTATCGGVSWRGVQQAAAAEWALKAINHQTITNHSIGLQVLDTCGDATIALQQLLSLVSRNAEEGAPALIGVVAVGGTVEAGALQPLLASLNVPLLVTSVEASYDLTPSPVLFSASPHLETLMKIINFQRSNHLTSEDVVILLLTLQEAQQLLTDGSLKRISKLRWLLTTVEDDPWAHEQIIVKVKMSPDLQCRY
ncbi:Receptor ligand binding region [Trinorchestia longiramus]|nr:Receptor ligand binding region [Trinorchestia longiramus]